jgi:hypothetical protein
VVFGAVGNGLLHPQRQVAPELGQPQGSVGVDGRGALGELAGHVRAAVGGRRREAVGWHRARQQPEVEAALEARPQPEIGIDRPYWSRPAARRPLYTRSITGRISAA